MNANCKNRCKAYEPVWFALMGSHYALGHKKCNNCDRWLKTEFIFCPCCKTRLNYKPRTKPQKLAYEKAINIMEKMKK